jgi:hypothetical protein
MALSVSNFPPMISSLDHLDPEYSEMLDRGCRTGSEMACVVVMTVVLVLLRRAEVAAGFSDSTEESTVSHLIDR